MDSTMYNLILEEQKTYDICLGQCSKCLLNGECKLQEKIKEKTDETNNTTISRNR